MKKGLKKQIEHELTEAIEKTLSGHNSRAASKTKKTIKEASKSVGKKFIKTLKALGEKKQADAKAKKKDSKKKSKVKNAVASRKVKPRKKVTVRQARKKVALPAEVETSSQTVENFLEQN